MVNMLEKVVFSLYGYKDVILTINQNLTSIFGKMECGAVEKLVSGQRGT